MTDFILYGAYGYTGQLITQMAKDYGLQPLLSGRNAAKLRPLAETHGFEHVAVDLADRAAIEELLARAPIVLHAAGPFIHTAKPMLEACLATGTHYLDITGEIGAFSKSQRRDQRAKEANIMLMPGVGFDVVPTDCMAAYLKERLPDATHLKLAFAWSGGGVSQGTAKSMLNGMGHPGAIREDGQIKPVKPGYKSASFPFTADKKLSAITIPWGDVFTAYFTTGIPNIETYFAAHPKQQANIRRSAWMGPVLRLGFVKNYLRKKIEQRPAGPSDEQRQQGRAFVYGEVRNAAGEKRAARINTLEGYTLTAITALIIAKRVKAGNWKPGFWTPAGLYGKDLIMEVPDTQREDVSL
ncbi:MAG: saccharopine dehydrogenase NADP-binding domain-containing protein [Bacteroidota bacterium]